MKSYALYALVVILALWSLAITATATAAAAEPSLKVTPGPNDDPRCAAGGGCVTLTMEALHRAVEDGYAVGWRNGMRNGRCGGV